MEKTPNKLLKKEQPVKIVLIGPESTGKTTLAKELADHYHTIWIPEFSREYAQQKRDKHKKHLDKNDVIPIGLGQINLENRIINNNLNKDLVILDTDILATQVYANAYYQQSFKEIDQLISNNTGDFYLLCNIDIPWVADGVRDKPNERQSMFLAFKKTLIKHQKPHCIISGNSTERKKTAIKKINFFIHQLNTKSPFV